MKKKYLFEKIKSDIISSTTHNFILGVNGKFKGFDECLADHIEYIKYTNEYTALFLFREVVDYSRLELTFFTENCSENFLKYIYDFLTCEDECFYKKISNIIVNDYHNELLKIQTIEINNALIDNKFIDILSNYFPNLNQIKFFDCIIKEKSSFYKLKGDLYFSDCEIENINSFNYCTQKLSFNNSKINKIENLTINSNDIVIKFVDDTNLAKLFLMCHFPNLEKLVLGDVDAVGISPNNIYYQKCLLYLPYSCPNLNSLEINGKVYSFVFLNRLGNLSECEINSVDDSIGPYKIYNPYVANKFERSEIINNSNRNINDAMDIHLTMYDKLQEILKTISLFGYSQEEKNIYIKNNIPTILLNPLENFQCEDVSRFYSYNINEHHLQLRKRNNLNIKDIFLANDAFYETDREFAHKGIMSKKQIVISKPFLYHPSGVPIIFTEQDMTYRKFVEKAREIEEWFITDCEELTNNEERKESLTIKKERYLNLLMDILIESYDKFSVEELIQIFYEIKNADQEYVPIQPFYGINFTENTCVLEKIDKKTNHKFVKYLKLISMTNKQRKI